MRPILAHSEKAAAYMADGYARAPGRVCMAQSVGAVVSREYRVVRACHTRLLSPTRTC